jgi:hypothetical protein
MSEPATFADVLTAANESKTGRNPGQCGSVHYRDSLWSSPNRPRSRSRPAVGKHLCPLGAMDGVMIGKLSLQKHRSTRLERLATGGG